MCLDVTNVPSIRLFVDEVLQKFGRIDVLVNNSGIILQRSIDEQTVDDWDRLDSQSAWSVSDGQVCGSRNERSRLKRLSDLPGDAAVVPYVLGC